MLSMYNCYLGIFLLNGVKSVSKLKCLYRVIVVQIEIYIKFIKHPVSS